MKMNIGKLRTLLKLPPPKEGGKPLTEEQKRKRAGYIVYPVLVLLCAGCVWLALSPSEKEQAKAGQGNGFNTEIPLPEDSRIQESKVAAYEHEEMEKKEKLALGACFGFLFQYGEYAAHYGPNSAHSIWVNDKVTGIKSASYFTRRKK